jgi:hypothetical protein
MLHPCSELPEYKDEYISNNDQQCLDFIERNYHFIQPKGYGGFGATFLIRHSNKEQLVLKMTKYNDDAVDEIRASCFVNNLIEHSSCFIRTFGWIVCDNMPNEWRTKIIIDKPNLEWVKSNDPIMYMLMEEVPDSWKNYSIILLDYEIVMILFEILHALYIGRKLYKYSHNDLFNGKNIMLLSTSDSSTKKILNIENYSFTLIGWRWTPKFIDHGQTTYHDEIEDSYDLRDVEDIIMTRVHRMQHGYTPEFINDLKSFFGQPLYQENMKSNSSNYHVIVELLLSSPIFDAIKREEKQFVGAHCISCGNIATIQYKECNGLRYCDKLCAKNHECLSTIYKE